MNPLERQKAALLRALLGELSRRGLPVYVIECAMPEPGRVTTTIGMDLEFEGSPSEAPLSSKEIAERLVDLFLDGIAGEEPFARV